MKKNSATVAFTAAIPNVTNLATAIKVEVNRANTPVIIAAVKRMARLKVNHSIKVTNMSIAQAAMVRLRKGNFNYSFITKKINETTMKVIRIS